MLISAPDAVREKYRGLTTLKLIEAIVCRPTPSPNHGRSSLLTAAKMLAQQVQFPRRPSCRAASPDRRSGQRSQSRAAGGLRWAPDTAAQLLITAGANPHRLHSEAAFAALLRAAPIPRPRARPPDTDSAAETAPPTTLCIASSLRAPGPPPTDQGLRPTSTAQGPLQREILRQTPSAPSPARSSNC